MDIGIVGVGYWGSKVIGEYADLRDEDIIDAVVACDVDEQRLTTVKRADSTETSIENLINTVDAIHLCTSTTTHFDIAKKALSKDVHVLVEKPMTTDRETAYDLVELASENGQILQTGHIFRFATVIRRIKELYEDGYFGTVYDLSLQWTHRMEPRTATNVIWDLMTHPVDIVNFITGEWPTDPVGTSSAHRSKIIDAATVQMKIEKTDLSIHVSWNDRIRRRQLNIAGSDRSAQIDCVDQTITVYENDESKQLPISKNNTIRTEAKNFIESIKTGNNTFNSAIVGARTVDKIAQVENAISDTNNDHSRSHT